MSFYPNTSELTPAQRDALALVSYRSPQSGKLVLTNGMANVRTVRKLAEMGLVELHEAYSRQGGGNVWHATITPEGEIARNEIRNG